VKESAALNVSQNSAGLGNIMKSMTLNIPRTSLETFN